MRMRRMRRVLRRLPLLALVVEGPLLALVVDGHGDRARLSASEAAESLGRSFVSLRPARCQEEKHIAARAIDRQAAAASQNEAEESDESEDEAAEAAGEERRE